MFLFVNPNMILEMVWDGCMEVPASLMYDEVEQLYNDEVLNTRRELQESSANLEQLAKYCEQSFLTCQDQQVFQIGLLI